jgi:glycosyltransferase involved in cell wall biosynthesis
VKILQLCHRIPFPPVDGGNIAMLNLSRSLLLQGHLVKIFALNTVKHYVNPDTLPELLLNDLQLESVNIDTSVSFSGAFMNLFSNESYNIKRFYNKTVEEKLVELLKQEAFDVIQLESLFMMPYLNCIRKHSKAKVVLRSHNIEHIIWKRLYQSEKNFARSWYLRLLAKRLKKFELDHLNVADAILPITANDAQLYNNLGCIIPLHVTPLGVDLDDYIISETVKEEWCLFHLGSMNWRPNLEGVEWFLENCWPRLRFDFPDLKLYLAGRGFPKRLIDLHLPNVICEGEISDSNHYSSDKKIMIVPLFSGSGMRVKIIQGMALAKTIISTTIGAEGIECTNGKDILIADTAEQFYEAVKKCLMNKQLADEIGFAGRKLITEKYLSNLIGKRLSDFYRKILPI